MYGYIAMCKFIIFESACYVSMADNIVLVFKSDKKAVFFHIYM